MTTVWITIALITVGTVAIKAIGPLALGGRTLPPQLSGVVARLAPALLAALVVVDTFGGEEERTIAVDESAIGLLAAAGALALRLPMVAVVVIAALVTAVTRAAL